MASAWKSLSGFVTPLLIQYEFGPSNYSIWLTDLTQIWSESLDRKRIIQKAFALDTSIDPSEDLSQMRLLLSSIQKALDEEDGTQATFSSEDNGEHIAMHLLTPLPAALQALQWDMSLQKLPPSTMTKKLVMPLLTQREVARAEQISLLQLLKDKDNIITKLINQMQADGSDMSKVFPGGASARLGHKSDIREALGRSVRGMAVFSEHAWRNRMSQEPRVFRNTQELLCSLSPFVFEEPPESFDLLEVVPWWQAPKQRTADQKNNPTLTEANRNNAKDSDAISRTANEFQRKPSPPTTSRRVSMEKSPMLDGKPKELISEDGNSTTDESDNNLDASLKESAPSKTSIHTKSLQRDVDICPRDNNDTTADQSSSEQSSVDLDEPSVQKIESATERQPSQRWGVSKPKSKLGKIGGKKTIEIAHGSSQSELSIRFGHDKASPAEKSAPKPQQLRAKTSPAPKAESMGRTATPAGDPSLPRETSQERADRNREQLKRQLDSKSQLATKKKRKF